MDCTTPRPWFVLAAFGLAGAYFGVERDGTRSLVGPVEARCVRAQRARVDLPGGDRDGRPTVAAPRSDIYRPTGRGR
jgi:hypothetical protein